MPNNNNNNNIYIYIYIHTIFWIGCRTCPGKLQFYLVGMEHCSNWNCAEHVRNTFPRFYIRYASIISIWIFGRMEMVDMTNLRIRFFEIEKCKQFSKLTNFWYLNPFACHWHPAGAFFLVKIAILDVRNMCGTRCAEHVRNMEHVRNLWNHVRCQLSIYMIQSSGFVDPCPHCTWVPPLHTWVLVVHLASDACCPSHSNSQLLLRTWLQAATIIALVASIGGIGSFLGARPPQFS